MALYLTAPLIARDRVGAISWPGFQIIIWQNKTVPQYLKLRAMGVTAARVQANRHGETRASAARKVAPLKLAGLRPYIENIATDFYSAYHRWTPHKPVNWRFVELQALAAKGGQDKYIFRRQPSLSDRHALRVIERRLTQTVRAYAAYHPLYFNLGDETGIADLSAAWDFDYSRPSLRAMRVWLRRQYRTLAALNREWGTQFPDWRDVTPPTTTETMARTDGNYAAWSDFKAFMDFAFANAIHDGSSAVHRGAPWARSAIEGAQIPGWGGYDYARLAPAVDVMELYDVGENLALAQSFHPGLIALTTSNWSHPNAQHYAWREFLRGTRGMILWDPTNGLVQPDGEVTTEGKRAACFFAEMRTGVGPLIRSSERLMAPVAILYSPESFRIQWLLDHRNLGEAWTQRGSAAENEDNAVRRTQHRDYKMFLQLGLTPEFVDERQISAGILVKRREKILILPQTLSLSRRSAGAIRNFVKAGGILVTDGQVGLFDGHGRRLALTLLAHLLKSGNPHVVALPASHALAVAMVLNVLRAADISWQARIRTPADRIEEFVYQHGSVRLLVLLSDASISETGRSVPVTLLLPHAANAYDIRARRFLGNAVNIKVDVSNANPTVLALTNAPLSRRVCRELFKWDTCPDQPHDVHKKMR